jgi:hypothetical protein
MSVVSRVWAEVATTTAGMEFTDLLCAADNQLYEAKG